MPWPLTHGLATVVVLLSTGCAPAIAGALLATSFDGGGGGSSAAPAPATSSGTRAISMSPVEGPATSDTLVELLVEELPTLSSLDDVELRRPPEANRERGAALSV